MTKGPGAAPHSVAGDAHPATTAEIFHVQSSSLRRAARGLIGCVALLSAAPIGCGGTMPARSPVAQKWFVRAQDAFKVGDFEEAHETIARALNEVPKDEDDIEVRLLGAKIALASLDYAETLRLAKGVKSSEAAGIRGRALWYKGDLDAAADELDAMQNDPDAPKDEWAKATSKLARRGQGRTPFVLSGGMLAAVEMVHVSPNAPYFVVPVEIDGEAALAMLATGTAEVVLDSATRPEPSWVSLRFGGRLEVHDVPALAQDLSGVSKELGAPIKALLGVNLLRHLNATMDYAGHQFVARNFTAPPPPNATRLDLHYVRGGGLVVRASLGGEKGPRGALLVDTSRAFPLALDKDGWKKAGVGDDGLKPYEGDPEQKLKVGMVPLLRLGAFDIPRVGGLYGVPFNELEQNMQVDIDGVIGAGLLYQFRCTFGDGGRLLWIEDNAASEQLLNGGAPPPPPAQRPSNQREEPPAKPPEPPAKPAPPPAGANPNKSSR